MHLWNPMFEHLRKMVNVLKREWKVVDNFIHESEKLKSFLPEAENIQENNIICYHVHLSKCVPV